MELVLAEHLHFAKELRPIRVIRIDRPGRLERVRSEVRHLG
jgi:hypothetical protein